MPKLKSGPDFISDFLVVVKRNGVEFKRGTIRALDLQDAKENALFDVDPANPIDHLDGSITCEVERVEASRT